MPSLEAKALLLQPSISGVCNRLLTKYTPKTIRLACFIRVIKSVFTLTRMPKHTITKYLLQWNDTRGSDIGYQGSWPPNKVNWFPSGFFMGYQASWPPKNVNWFPSGFSWGTKLPNPQTTSAGFPLDFSWGILPTGHRYSEKAWEATERFSGHSWRSKKEVLSQLLLWEPRHGQWSRGPGGVRWQPFSIS